jgi:type I restriction enzyme, R subunit
LAEAQTRFYVEEIGKRQATRPFAFMTNGTKTYFWDVGEAPKREVHGFFSRADLENQLFMRQRQFALSATPIDAEIINRPYQHEAVRRVAEAFESGQRRALLVMATGTGKTRTAMALVKLFLDSNQTRRILFVADRDALVSQALEEGSQDHLPDEPATRIYGHRIERESRLFVVTLQTLNSVFREFPPRSSTSF